jgi:hypothetical protein
MSAVLMNIRTWINETEPKDWRRMLIKVSTAIMISIIGPAGAWDAAQHEGLLIYLLIYVICKAVSAKLSSLSSRNALLAHRMSPALLIIAGIISIVNQSWQASVVFVAALLGSYEGAYWTGYFDLPEKKEENGEVQWMPMGCPRPNQEQIGKAKLLSQPFAISQFVVVNAMRFGALQRGVVWLGAFVVISEVVAYVVSIAYKRWKKKESEQESKTKKELWRGGQGVFFLSFFIMILGLHFDYFLLFTIGWLVGQGVQKGVLRPLEMKFASGFLKPSTTREEEEKNDLNLNLFQAMEVLAAVAGVGVTTYLKVQDTLAPSIPSLLAIFIVLISYMIPFRYQAIEPTDLSLPYEIGLRERLKFKMHLILMILTSILFYNFSPQAKSVAMGFLLVGFFTSVLAVYWAYQKNSFPTLKS